jgi:hypothetical protein
VGGASAGLLEVTSGPKVESHPRVPFTRGDPTVCAKVTNCWSRSAKDRNEAFRGTEQADILADEAGVDRGVEAARRTAPFPAQVAAPIDAFIAEHRALAWPAPVSG